MAFKLTDLRYAGDDLRWYDVELPWTENDHSRYVRTNRNACRIRSKPRRRGSDLGFLRELQPLHGVQIDRGPRRDDVVFQVPDLVCLVLANRGVTPFNPENLKNLAQLVTDSRPDIERVSECRSLRFLRVARWEGDNLTFVGDARPIEYLRVEGRGQEFTFDGLDGPEGLRVCWIDSMTPRSLSGLQAQPGLQYLYVDSPRRAPKRTLDLGPVGQLASLEWLNLQRCGRLASLAPLRNLQSLQGVSLGASDVADGDMTPLIDLPESASVSFADMPHYSHTLDEIVDLRASKFGKKKAP